MQFIKRHRQTSSVPGATKDRTRADLDTPVLPCEWRALLYSAHIRCGQPRTATSHSKEVD